MISLPFLGSLYYATAGRGAFRDEHPIAASGTDSLSAAIVSIGDYEVGQDAEKKNRTASAVTSALAASVQRIRMIGSAAIDLAWVAEGKLDATVILANEPWDTSAGVLIAREAGAAVLDRDGSSHGLDSTATIAFAPPLAIELLPLLKRALDR
ncbi:MAG: inositol monophosphatase [Pseudonocardiaceae bacterium]